jgi:hypothetical protein
LTKLGNARHVLADLGWRGVQVFIASLLVELVDAVVPPRELHPDTLWRDCALAAVVAVLSQALTLAAYQIGHRHDDPGLLPPGRLPPARPPAGPWCPVWLHPPGGPAPHRAVQRVTLVSMRPGLPAPL